MTDAIKLRRPNIWIDAYAVLEIDGGHLREIFWRRSDAVYWCKSNPQGREAFEIVKFRADIDLPPVPAKRRSRKVSA